MSLIPDVRNDDTYNDQFLDEKDENFVAGYDTAFEEIITLFADNLSTYEGELTELCPEGYTPESDEAFSKREDLYSIVEDNKEILCAIIKDWLEAQRDEIVTSMIDSYDADYYGELKAEAVKRNPELEKVLYDTRKLYSGTSGSKQDT